MRDSYYFLVSVALSLFENLFKYFVENDSKLLYHRLSKGIFIYKRASWNNTFRVIINIYIEYRKEWFHNGIKSKKILSVYLDENKFK